VDGSLSFAFLAHTCRLSRRLFHGRSPPWLIHHSSSWRFDTSTCMPMPKDLPSSPQQHGHCYRSAFYVSKLQLPSGHTNAQAESFNATLKVERVNRTVYPTREHARKDVTRYIELHYNT